MSRLIEMLLPILLIIGGILSIVYFRPKMLNHVREMKFMTTSTFEDLQNMFGMMQADGLGDTFRHYVEVKGNVYCDQAVHTPFSGKDVAYCSSQLYAVMRSEEYYQDSDGNTHKKTGKREDLISDEDSSHVLLMKSDTSDMRLVLDITNGCQFDVAETFDRFEPVSNLGTYSYFRNFHHRGGDLLGYHMKEKTIALNQPLYVLGEAYKEGSDIHIGKPMDKGKSFIVSTKSEDALVGKYETNAKIALFGGIACAVIGVLILVVQIIG